MSTTTVATVYAETLVKTPASERAATVYAEALIKTASSARLATVYVEMLIPAEVAPPSSGKRRIVSVTN